MNTCLFTGAVLDRHTPAEHTIPRALGGRFRSNRVASAKFNHACGDTIDPQLYLAFAPIMNVLAPLLSSEHQPGAIAVLVNRPGRYVVEGGSVLSRRDFEVTRDTKTGLPKYVSGPDRAIQRFAKKSKLRVTDLPPMPSCDVTRADMRLPLLSADLELCALKSAILTFDHLLAENPNRFTRSKPLQEVLDRIRRRVLGESSDSALLRENILGVDNQLLHSVKELCRSVGHAATPFEHILVATGNAGQRTVSMIWCILGFEVHRFRLTTNWRGTDFTYLVKCPVLCNQHPPTLIDCNLPVINHAQRAWL